MVASLPVLIVLAAVLSAGTAAGMGSSPSRAGQQQPQILLRTGEVRATKATSVLSKPTLSAAEADTLHPFLITFSSPISEQAKSQASSLLGTEFTHYIPQNTFLVWATAGAAREAARLDGVAWVGELEAKHKVSPDIASLKKQPKKQGQGEDDTIELVVTLAPTTAPSAAQMREMASSASASSGVEGGAEQQQRRRPGSVGHDVKEVADRISSGFASLSLKTAASAQPSSDRLTVQTTAGDAEKVAAFLAQQKEVAWVEVRAKMVPLRATQGGQGQGRVQGQHPPQQQQQMRNGRVVIRGIEDAGARMELI